MIPHPLHRHAANDDADQMTLRRPAVIRRQRILVVDDLPESADSLAKLLNSMGQSRLAWSNPCECRLPPEFRERSSPAGKAHGRPAATDRSEAHGRKCFRLAWNSICKSAFVPTRPRQIAHGGAHRAPHRCRVRGL